MELQTGVPALITEDSTLGIRLQSILRLTAGSSVCKYLDTDGYLPQMAMLMETFSVDDDDLRFRTFIKKDGDTPEQMYQDFYNDYRQQYQNNNLRFGIRTDQHPNLQNFPISFSQSFTNQPARRTYTDATLQRGCARPTYIGQKNIVYVYSSSSRSRSKKKMRIIVGYRRHGDKASSKNRPPQPPPQAKNAASTPDVKSRPDKRPKDGNKSRDITAPTRPNESDSRKPTLSSRRPAEPDSRNRYEESKRGDPIRSRKPDSAATNSFRSKDTRHARAEDDSRSRQPDSRKRQPEAPSKSRRAYYPEDR